MTTPGPDHLRRPKLAAKAWTTEATTNASSLQTARGLSSIRLQPWHRLGCVACHPGQQLLLNMLCVLDALLQVEQQQGCVAVKWMDSNGLPSLQIQ